MKWSLDIYDTLDSTQDLIKVRALEGAPEGTVVQALSQTKGRGRHGRQWWGGQGNLALSFLLRPSCTFYEVGQISLLTGWAVAQTLQAFMEIPSLLHLKWPNDVLIEKKKCAGLLIEAGSNDKGALDYLAVGIGINVKNAPLFDTAVAFEPYSRSMVGDPLDHGLLREALFRNFETCYRLWEDQGFKPVKEGWLERGHRIGDALNVKIGTHRIEGYFSGINEDGALCLRTENGEKIITAGDIYDAFGY